MSQFSLDEIMVCPRLPSLPAVAVRLLELTSDPDVAISDIAKLVQQDQALAAKVLKTVNSSFYGLSSPCGSIDRAMGYLGLNTVKSLVLGFSLVEASSAADEGVFDMDAHWRRAIIGSTGARVLAKAVGGVDPEDAFTASLFQDMGMLACYVTMKAQYISAIEGVPHRSLCKQERELFGFDHTQVGAALASRWKLPKEVSEAIRCHHDPDGCTSEHRDLARLVSVGAMICACMDHDAPSSSVSKLERVMGEYYGARAPSAKAVLEEAGETATTLAKMFEQDIGSIPNAGQLIAAAQEKGVEHQLSMQRQADALAREAMVDGLTQIANRKRFDAELERAYDAFVSQSTPFGVLFFDADKFKSVNDTYGHAAGDVVLIELARRATEIVGDDGIVARYGGEEFAVIVEGHDIDWCADLAERIRVSLCSTPFDLRSVEGVPDELAVTASIGVSSTDAGNPNRLSSGAQIVHEADECVYAAKADGRNNVKVYGRYSQVTIASTREDEAPLGMMPKAAGVKRGRVERILLVEDDALAATLVISLLKRRGNIEVEWVKSGTEACSLIEQGSLDGDNAPKLILCDFSLPGCNGHEVLRVAQDKASVRDIPFVMLTGNNDEHMREESLRRGATQFIHKDEFCADVNRWLGELIRVHAKTAA